MCAFLWVAGSFAALWLILLVPIIRSVSEDVAPNDLTRLDVLDRTHQKSDPWVRKNTRRWTP